MFARCLCDKVSYPDVCPQTQWSRAAAGYWCTARRESPAPPPSAWPISCTRGASGWTRPSTSWSSGAMSSRQTWHLWGSCCSSRPTCCAKAEAPGAEQEGSTRVYNSPALVRGWAFSGLHDSSAHCLLWVKHIWRVSCAQHLATWTVKSKKNKIKNNCSALRQTTWRFLPEESCACSAFFFFCICFDLCVWSLARAVSVSISCLLSSNHCDIFLRQQHCVNSWQYWITQALTLLH